MTLLLAPSILSADFASLGEEVQRAERAGADWIHVDVMDGHFVPNLTIGADVTAAVRRVTRLPVDVHLMIEAPERLIPDFVRAGADRITVHLEACPHLHRVLGQLREAGVGVGVALNPATPVEALREIVPLLDLVLVMTVNPGFGGQRFIATSPDKVARVAELLRDQGRLEEVLIQVDGGMDRATIGSVVAAGARVIVAGNALFRDPAGLEDAMLRLRRAAEAGATP